MTTQTTNSLRSAQPAELSDDDLEHVTGGVVQDMTNNRQTTAQKAAEKADAYLRS